MEYLVKASLDKKITNRQKVLVTLTFTLNNGLAINKSVSEVAEMMGISERALRNDIKALKDQGYWVGGL
jgi:biotin operon repressor